MKVEQVGIHAMMELLEIYPKALNEIYRSDFSDQELEENIEKYYDFWAIKEKLADNGNLFFFLYNGDDVEGLLGLIIENGQLIINELYLKEYTREKLNQFYEKCKEIKEIWKLTKIVAFVQKDREFVINFFEGQGFDSKETQKKFMKKDIDLVVMSL